MLNRTNYVIKEKGAVEHLVVAHTCGHTVTYAFCKGFAQFSAAEYSASSCCCCKKQ